MQKNENVPEMPPGTDQDFPRFLKQVRKEENVLLDQLAQDLMTSSHLARIEKGQRLASKNMRDRLLGRLGISSDLYENMLNSEDYAAWEQQRNILCAIEQGAFQKAQDLIDVYDRQAPEAGKDKIKQQFCLVMQAEILKQQHADPCVIGDCYERAVKLTVPDVEDLRIEHRLLSVQEVNMILEYAFYHKGADFAEKCKALTAFVENSVYDSFSKVKIYPKLVCYYLWEMFHAQESQTADELEEGLRRCRQAIEMLRDTGRAYFLLELLELESRLMQCMGSDADDSGRNAQLVKLLKELYAEYGVPAYMQGCTYLYQQRWVFCIGDVLRIRRTMFGLTQQELCGNDCSVRTLRRTERKEANMQYEALGVLLEKLGLSREFQRARLVSNDREVLKLREEISACCNNRELERARELLEQMRAKVSDEIPENMQYFIELEASLDRVEGRITRKEFAARAEDALRCTLKATDLYDMDEVYLTQMEMKCFRNRILGCEEAEKKKSIDFILRFFEWYEKKCALSDCVGMYEFAMECVVAELGDAGEHQQAVDLCKRMVGASLACRRIWGIDGYLYEALWNECRQQAVVTEKITERLQQCALLSHFCKRSFYEEFYAGKMDQVWSSIEIGRSLHGDIPLSSE